MMFNIIFSVSALLLVAQVQSEITTTHFFKTHNPVAEAAAAKLDEAVNLLKEKVEEKNKAIALANKLQEGAVDATNKVYQAVKTNLHFFETQVSKLTYEADVDGVNVTKCKKMKNSLHHTVFEMINNSSKCLNEKVSEGKSFIDLILEKTQMAIDDLTRITSEANQCFKNIKGIKVVNRFTCLTFSGIKASWAVSRHAAPVVLNIKKLQLLISNLHTQLLFCANKKVTAILTNDAFKILKSVQNCVIDQIQKKRKTTEGAKRTSPMITALQVYDPYDKIRYDMLQYLKKESFQFTESSTPKSSSTPSLSSTQASSISTKSNNVSDQGKLKLD